MLIGVTGATGFVGGRLVPELARRGHRVLAYGRRPIEQARNLSDVAAYTQWDLTSGPIAGVEDQNVDAVVHCAGMVSDWGPAKAFEAANVSGTVAALETFRGAARFVYISSASVYDPFTSTRLLREDAPYAKRYLNSYAQTKLLAECAVRRRERLWVILRPHAIYGPGDPTLVPRLLAARRGGRLLAIGNGRNSLSITHVDNLVHAIVLAIEGDADRRIFNIADAVVARFDDLLRTLLERLGLPPRVVYIPTALAAPVASILERAYRMAGAEHPPLLTPYIVHQLAHDYTLDISAAQQYLGYAPAFTYKNGPLMPVHGEAALHRVGRDHANHVERIGQHLAGGGG